MKRRDFLKIAGLSAAAVLHEKLLPRTWAESMEETPTPKCSQIPRRGYGNKGEKLSIIGLGGVVLMGEEQKRANRVVAEVFERGVNYFDVAPSYGDAEIKLGPALEPYRKNCFLACKTLERNRKGAERELNQTLERLRTDYIDLYQLHALTKVAKDVDAVFVKDGAMETLIEAKKTGKVRYLGFSAHSEEAALAAMERYPFDSILFPINFACWYKGDFGPRVVEKAKKNGTAILAIKATARERRPEGQKERKQFPKCWYIPLSDRKQAELGLKFALNQPITALVPPGDESMFRLALDLATGLTPLTAEEEDNLKKLAQELNPIFKRA